MTITLDRLTHHNQLPKVTGTDSTIVVLDLLSNEPVSLRKSDQRTDKVDPSAIFDVDAETKLAPLSYIRARAKQPATNGGHHLAAISEKALF